MLGMRLGLDGPFGGFVKGLGGALVGTWVWLLGVAWMHCIALEWV